ncbi:MAG: iron transporter FeoB [Ignavibacteriae bacterium HGW-Ignavibacteriae-2]|jgi:ferrous iron transport protein B|nr:MAG: iron transporter FeoB [Ignavibacteriae bacterium HGW-Ignavibacteriae-2]
MNELNNCENCPVHNINNLVKLGINMDKFDYVVALAGNPNTGKSTIFNNLTGLRQHTGNWPGKTVARAEGGFSYANKNFKIVDLPGTYSLLSTSTDEDIARNFILFGKPDVTVIVVDSTRLERNLNLVLQILEITDRAVLVLNLMDELKRNKMEIDVRALSKELGIPVIPTEARQKKGMDEVLRYIDEVANGSFVCAPRRIKSISSKVDFAINDLTIKLQEQFPKLPNKRWVAMRLLEGDQSMIDAVNSGEIGNLEITSNVMERSLQ